jgi:hypothetical protein
VFLPITGLLTVPQVWRPPTVAARPLPSTFPVQEEIEPLSSDETLESGTSVSKYVSDKDAEDSNRHICETKYWCSLKDDPIFRVIVTDGETISIEELASRRNRILRTHSLRVLNETEKAGMDQGSVEAGRDRPSNDRSPGYGDPHRQEPEQVNGRVSPRERSQDNDRRRFHHRQYFARNCARNGRRTYRGSIHQRVKRQAGDTSSSSLDRHIMPGSCQDPTVETHPHQMQPFRDSDNGWTTPPKPEYTPGRGGSGKQQPPSHLSYDPCQDEKTRSWSARGPPQSQTKGRKRARINDPSEDCYERPQRQENDISSKARSWETDMASIYR